MLDQQDKLFWVDSGTGEVYVNHPNPQSLVLTDPFAGRAACNHGTVYVGMDLGYCYDGVKYYGKNNVQFYECHIHHCAHQGILASTHDGKGGAGLVVDTCQFSNIGKQWKVIMENGTMVLKENNLDHGIYDNGTNSTIKNNEFHGIPHHQHRARYELTIYNGANSEEEGHLVADNLVLGSVNIESANCQFNDNDITTQAPWWFWINTTREGRPCLCSLGNTINGQPQRS